MHHVCWLSCVGSRWSPGWPGLRRGHARSQPQTSGPGPGPAACTRGPSHWGWQFWCTQCEASRCREILTRTLIMGSIKSVVCNNATLTWPLCGHERIALVCHKCQIFLVPEKKYFSFVGRIMLIIGSLYLAVCNAVRKFPLAKSTDQQIICVFLKHWSTIFDGIETITWRFLIFERQTHWF